jgi:hypothetical protein
VLVATVTLSLALGMTARAKGNGIPVRVDYRGAAGCGQESAFVERLLARSGHVRLASAGEPSPLLVVRVSRTSRTVHGHLVIHDVDGTQSSRDVDGDTCESVDSALVLVSALAIDPTAAGSSTGPTGQTGQTGDAGAPPSADGGEVAETHAAAVADAALAPAPAPSAPPDRPQGPPLDATEGWHLALGAGVQATWGGSPDVMPGLPAFVDLAHSTGSAWSPSLRAGFLYAHSGDQPVAGGGVRMVQTVATLDLCPLRWTAWNLRIAPCVHGEGGAADVSGVGVSPARSETRPWLAAGVLGRVRYVAISPFFIEIYGGADVTLQRDRFFFEPDSTVFRAPLVSGYATGALGLTIL